MPSSADLPTRKAAAAHIRSPHRCGTSLNEPPEAEPVTFFFHEQYGVPKQIVATSIREEAQSNVFSERVQLS